MTEDIKSSPSHKISGFTREFFDSPDMCTCIGNGEIGGKAHGLTQIWNAIESRFIAEDFPNVTVNIPTMTILTTEVFDSFMERNDLFDIAYSDQPDNRIAHAFQNAEFPAEFNGDLMALITKVKSPLAVRSSSLLEDAMYQPFAGVYATKMIPNNQFQITTRFQKLIEAVKFVWASTFFKEAKAYVRCTSERIEDEKMAVIIQEVIGQRHGDHYYPDISGVVRSYNYYPMRPAKPNQGVVSLALGLGRTIVDGGQVWTYSPALPRANPPFGSVGDLMKLTQVKFWAVNMGKPPEYDPINENEYLLHLDLKDAEYDGTLKYIASTYDAASDRISPQIATKGPRILNFAPILVLNELPLNKLIQFVLKICEEKTGTDSEIEFAVTIEQNKKMRFGFLQVRPMVVSSEQVEITPELLEGENVVVVSDSVLGNGALDTIRDVVFVKPDRFDKCATRKIAAEIEKMNVRLVNEQNPYILIGFGRWGSSDPWLGIPVDWSQISGAKAIVEATLPDMNVELSQGAHFLQNLSSFRILYLSVRHAREDVAIRWDWFEQQEVMAETDYVKHIRIAEPLSIMVDDRRSKGVIYHQ